METLNSISWNEFLEIIALEFKLTPSEMSVFLTRFDRANWIKTVDDVWEKSIVMSCESFVKHSTSIYTKFKSSCPEISNGSGNFTHLKSWLLEEFRKYEPGIVSLEKGKSRFFRTVQTSVELECYKTVLQPRSLIRIKAPKRMGKTLLLNNILEFSRRQQYRTVHINLSEVERGKLNSIDVFLRWLCFYINDILELDFNIGEWWKEERGSICSCIRYLEMVLRSSEKPLVLGFDEVDRILQYPDVSPEFFDLLRSRYEEGNNYELWERLRQIIVYSTEDFGSLDINKSPFNVGTPIELKNFNKQQVKELASLHDLNLSDEDINQLMELVGGHPYLTELAISRLTNNNQTDLSKLLLEALTDKGIYGSHLREHLDNLNSNEKLAQVFIEVLKNPKASEVNTLLAQQLCRMGLVQWSSEGNGVVPGCNLYKVYFKNALQINRS